MWCETATERSLVEYGRDLSLVKAIKDGDLDFIKRYYEEHPNSISAMFFTCFGRGTALHQATITNNLEIAKELVAKMSEEDVLICNDAGHTALDIAAITGGIEKIKIAECMIRKSKKLLTTESKGKLIPLANACGAGRKDMIYYLYSQTPRDFLLSEIGTSQSSLAIQYCIGNKMFGLEVKIPSNSSSTSDDVRISACDQYHQNEMNNTVAREKASFRRMWSSNLLKLFGIKQVYDLKLTHCYAHKFLCLMSKTIATLDVTKLSRGGSVAQALSIAASHGITEFIVEIISGNPDFLGPSQIFCTAVERRQEKVFSLIYGLGTMKDVVACLNYNGNNLLHVAAQLAPQRVLDGIPGPALQMQRELQWFQEVERIVPHSFRQHPNNLHKTPYEIFDESHKVLVQQGEKWMKDIAQSSMVVGTLIITIMFIALYTVPGGNNQETGFPLFLQNKVFNLFIISNATSFFASSTSVLMFLGILSSRYAPKDFLKSLPTKLIIALSSLFISIATMMVAFCSTVIIMLKGELSFIIPIVLLASIPVSLFVWLQFPLLVTVAHSTYGPGIFDRKTKKWL
ncbi:hypothetical protein COLO4_27230 [Corchorus olitorius]|uniref:PGG domain-containing protein n=1 Tax=Corchorus olitorius TaxID=93759 RepID=A0A1R3HS64_9ROSI|nr:hypothetical protein COLO4_27230 [Corchorus olitorius]